MSPFWNAQRRGVWHAETLDWVEPHALRVSAANGAIDHIKSLVNGTATGDWTSAAIVSKGEYGVPAGLVFGYPCTATGDGNWKVVDGLKLDAFGQAKFKITLDELLKEQEVVKDLLPG